ncbi:hypothetical protein RhiirC2_851500 [Rhizophagus irregularis]|uniref:FAD-binding domain-containing protein n=1 Tax=Rhizophagus irregularis TaxID=588596 RepID=A0A2N1N3A9_9GLOM|nr:hypothetical protein RhiirC2_851500 [Rhizophagus irregularis]
MKGTKGRNVLLAPPTKPFKDVYEERFYRAPLSSMITYRDRLRDVLLEVVPVQWNKKFGADGINSPILKHKLPELQIVNSHVSADISIPKHLMDKANKIHENVFAHKTLGTKGDSTFIMTRLIPIKQEQNDEKMNLIIEQHYHQTFIEHVKRLIRTLRPDCELTNLLLLELWDLAPKTIPNDPINSRVVLLGDAAHAMSPILGLGANNAIQDADKLSQALLRYTDDNTSFIEEYEKEMSKRTSADHS